MKRQKIGDSEIAVDTRMIANGLQQEMRDGQSSNLLAQNVKNVQNSVSKT